MGDFNTSLTPTDRSSKMKINKETEGLNDTIDRIDLIDIYRTFQPKTADYTFFSSAHGTFSRIDHILGHKSSHSKFKKIEIISSIFSDHNAMRLKDLKELTEMTIPFFRANGFVGEEVSEKEMVALERIVEIITEQKASSKKEKKKGTEKDKAENKKISKGDDLKSEKKQKIGRASCRERV